MNKKIHIYENDNIKVTYDRNRCIHAGECVRGLPKVFDTQKRPWVQPDQASAEKVADVIEKCPTGALHYEMKESSRVEQPQPKNRIQLTKNGPVYIFGDIEVQDHEGNTVLEDTRFAFCRCGQSKNKPACDDSHKKVNWKAGAGADTSKMPEIEENKHGKLIIKLMKDGPAILEGNYTMESAEIGQHSSSKGVALCRCGGSSNKPFCDGTHKEIDFKG
jgi:CDGSH-type Zn-finger protein/uncharacterized Fe-S cluster protein YjdI